MIDVLCVVMLLWLVLTDGRGFQWAFGKLQFRSTGEYVWFLQVSSISSLQSGREEMLVVVYSRRVRAARPSSPTGKQTTRLRHVRRLVGQQLWQRILGP
jgi:hypothetical protein